MTKNKKKLNLGKAVAGVTLVAATAGAAAVFGNKKNRQKFAAKAKKAVSRVKADPKAKEVGNDTADFLTKISDAIKNFFK
jgi:hypothetical protein